MGSATFPLAPMAKKWITSHFPLIPTAIPARCVRGSRFEVFVPKPSPSQGTYQHYVFRTPRLSGYAPLQQPATVPKGNTLLPVTLRRVVCRDRWHALCCRNARSDRGDKDDWLSVPAEAIQDEEQTKNNLSLWEGRCRLDSPCGRAAVHRRRRGHFLTSSIRPRKRRWQPPKTSGIGRTLAAATGTGL